MSNLVLILECWAWLHLWGVACKIATAKREAWLVRILTARKMRTPKAFVASMLVLCTAYLQPTFAQACTSQPVVTSLDPPSGTSGTDVGRSTYYTVSGQQLDQLADVFVLTDRNLSTLMRVGNSTTLSFYIEDARITPRDAVNAILFLVPTDRNCSTENITLTLFSQCEFFTNLVTVN